MSEMASDLEQAQVGDVIQIEPAATVKPPFHYKLAIVDEVKGWGVIAYVMTFTDATPSGGGVKNGAAYVRLPYGTFTIIGTAVYMIEIGEGQESDEPGGASQ